MDTNLTISKGIFVYKTKNIADYKRKDGTDNVFADQLWYQSFKSVWTKVEQKIEILNDEMFTGLLKNLVDSVKSSFNEKVTEVPTKTLLTGINMPDHVALFSTLCKEIKKSVTPHIAVLHTEHCSTLKNLVESAVDQFVNKVHSYESDGDELKSKIRKTYCTFAFLQAWYESLHGSTNSKRKTRSVAQPLVIIIPDFENFNEKSLQDFILIISSYLNVLPIILIFGIATSVNAIHRSLPFHVSSKINIQVFNTQPSHLYLNRIIESVLLTEDCPFHIGGKVFQCFTDIFLYYDLSVQRFIKNFKYAMLEHYSAHSIMALCTFSHKVNRVVEQLSDDDLAAVKSLQSVRDHIEGSDNFEETLIQGVQHFYSYLSMFHLYLKCLHSLVHSLPNCPLGKQVRELYSTATSGEITQSEGYIEAFKLLGFHSKQELTEKVSGMCLILEDHDGDEIQDVLAQLQEHLVKLEDATTEVAEEPKLGGELMLSEKMNRLQLKQKLRELTRAPKQLSNYDKARAALIQYLQDVFDKYLRHPSSVPFYELFFFNNLSIRQVLLGSHRSAIHTALNNPSYYFHCDCCKLTDDGRISASMPDISILYKLHLEYGKLINLYDWLQAFVTIVDPYIDSGEEDAENRPVSPEVQYPFVNCRPDYQIFDHLTSSWRVL
uniref:Origin recognition complex subunit 3 n=3 Tax=Photinus pyralis TaxID=7054 RepID=A0A1Y1MP20_PHOPY